MLLRVLVAFANAFVCIYAIDAVFSLIEEGLRSATGSQHLLGTRNVIALTVVAAAPFALIAATLSRRLPPLVLVALAGSALWFAYGAAPLPILCGDATSAVLVLIQLALALFALLRIRAASGGTTWLITAEPPAKAPREPAFSPTYTLASLCLLIVGGAMLAAAYLPLWFATTIETTTDGFVHFDRNGIGLADRHYARDGTEVRLVGMMHIGENEGYTALVESFVESSTIVLAEGVSDDQQLLEDELSYEGLASGLGLDTQGSIESYLDEIETRREPEQPLLRPLIRYADVDVSSFHPTTRELLDELGNLWDGDEIAPTLLAVARRVESDPERMRQLERDILHDRNTRLLEEIEAAIAEEFERIIVPWGALHLPFIQSQIEAMGFELRSEAHHPLASWSTIFGALFGAGGGAATPPGDSERSVPGTQSDDAADLQVQDTAALGDGVE